MRTLELLKETAKEIEEGSSESFDLGGQGVNDQDLEVLVKAFNKNSKIEDLDLSCNNISSEGVKSLLKLKYIKIIDLHINNVDDDGALELAKKFAHIILIQNPLSRDGKGIKKIIDCKEAKFSLLIVENRTSEGGAMQWLPEDIRQQLRQRNNLEPDVTNKENMFEEKSNPQTTSKEKKSGNMIYLAKSWKKLRGPNKLGTIDNIPSSSSFKSGITK